MDYLNYSGDFASFVFNCLSHVKTIISHQHLFYLKMKRIPKTYEITLFVIFMKMYLGTLYGCMKCGLALCMDVLNVDSHSVWMY